MTNPLHIAKWGLDLAGAVFGAKATNSAARRNFQNAQIDAAFQYTQNNRLRIERNRAVNQQGLDAALAARAATASAVNSGVSGGIQGATMDALIAEELRTGAINQSRIQDQRDNNTMATVASARGIEAQTQSRINQTPVAEFGLLDYMKLNLQSALGIQAHERQLDQVGRGGNG